MKADPKLKAEAKAEAGAEAPAKNSKKKLLIIVIVALVAIGAASGIAWHFMHPTTAHKEAKVEAPVFVPLEPFTVNLQPETGEQFLQTNLTLQVMGATQVDVIKQNMPQVRSRLLLLLSSKKASEISTSEGKKKLSNEIIAQMKLPFAPNAAPQEVTSVFFTSFIIQQQ